MPESDSQVLGATADSETVDERPIGKTSRPESSSRKYFRDSPIHPAIRTEHQHSYSTSAHQQQLLQFNMDVQQKWNAVNTYFEDALHPPSKDPALANALKANEEADLDAIDVSSNYGAMLNMFVKMLNAKHVLEVGCLGGYSAIWMARALPADGKLVSLELDPYHAKVATKNLEQAGEASKVDILVGPALDSMAKMDADGIAFKWDFVFIDADKENNAPYLEWALKHSHAGTVLVIDNMVRSGRVAEANTSNPTIQGCRALVDTVAKNPRLEAFGMQTVCNKGYDGFVMVRVKE